MIPKVIHYCWFGGNPKNDVIMKCIESWKKYAPDFEIVEWNEDNFDVNKYTYTKQAYEAKKFAFVSDVARFDVLYQYGGIYVDTDVELLKPIDGLLNNRAFMGYDQKAMVATGLIMGSEREAALLREILKYYETNSFYLPNGRPNTTNVVTIVSDILNANGFVLDGKQSVNDGVILYPWDYFDPYNYEKKKLTITDNTISIHHYESSWKTPADQVIFKIGLMVKRIVGESLYKRIAEVKHKIYG